MEAEGQNNSKMKTYVEATLFYGDSCCGKKELEPTTIAYDFCDKIEEEKILNYKIHKIICKNNSKNQYIDSIKIICKNRLDGKIETLIDTPSMDSNLIQMEFELAELEEIISVRVWTNNRLLGFEIKTNKNRIKKFGYGDEYNLIKIDDLETGDKIIVGFGVYACEQLGVTSLFCYYTDIKFYSIVLYSGIFYLRAKIKKNRLEANVTKKEDEKMYAIKRLCELPDILFFEIMKFATEK